MELFAPQPPLPVLVSTPERDPAIYIRVDTGSTISGSTLASPWTPGAQARFVLKGGALTAFVTGELAASAAGVLALWDQYPSGGCVYPIATYAPDERKNTLLTDGVLRFDMGVGQAGKAIGNALVIGCSESIGSGSIRVVGTLWGEEVAQ